MNSATQFLYSILLSYHAQWVLWGHYMINLHLPFIIARRGVWSLNICIDYKVNFLVPRMYLVKLHGTHFNYVLACISDMFMYSNTGFARYHILPWTFAHCIFSLLFSCLLFLFVFKCVYVLYCYHELVNKDLYIDLQYLWICRPTDSTCRHAWPSLRNQLPSSLRQPYQSFVSDLLIPAPTISSNSVYLFTHLFLNPHIKTMLQQKHINE